MQISEGGRHAREVAPGTHSREPGFRLRLLRGGNGVLLSDNELGRAVGAGGLVELSNRELVGRGLEVLGRGLGPFVDRRMAAFLPSGRGWLQVMIERARRDGRWPRLTRSDTRLLLRVIEENPKAFAASLSKRDLAYVREAREVANCWAHFEPFTSTDARRALDTVALLLRAAGAAGEAGQADALLTHLRPGEVPEVRVAAGPPGTGGSSRPDGAAPSPPATAAGRPADQGQGDRSGSAGDAVLAFRDRDGDYLAWVAANQGGYVLNTGPRGGDARLHRAACLAIVTTRPFTSGSYIKVCSASPGELDQWTLSRTGSAPRRCGLCHPPDRQAPGADSDGSGNPAAARRLSAAAPGWRAHGPRADLPEVWLAAGHYIPFGKLSPGDLAARADLRQRLRVLRAGPDEILEASYAGPKPANADVENLVLYNIDTGGGCFADATRHGVRFEMAAKLPSSADSGFRCHYRYRLITPDSELQNWRKTRQPARFDEADLGLFPGARRLEQAWLAIHQASSVLTERGIAAGAPFAVFLDLTYPQSVPTAARPELVKALIDAATVAFQGHSNKTTLTEISRRVAATTAEQPGTIATMLTNAKRAVLGTADKLVYPRGQGVQWNPGDHACMAGQVTCTPRRGASWTLSGKVYELQHR